MVSQSSSPTSSTPASQLAPSKTNRKLEDVKPKPLFLDDEDAEEIEADPLADMDEEEDDGTPAPRQPKATIAGREGNDTDGDTDAKRGNFFDEDEDDE